MKRFSQHSHVIVLTASLTIAFVLTCIVVMQFFDMGHDIANYLVTMNTVFGDDVVGEGLLRPPLIAFPLGLFTLAFGTLTGAKVLGVLVSVAIGVPFYLLARRICHPWIAVAVSIMFVFCPPYPQMLSWGYLTLIAIFFMLLTLHFLLQVLDKPSTGNVILTGLFASLLVGFHQLSFAFFVILMAAFLIALLVFNRQQLFGSYKPLAAAVVTGGILSIPYVPTYIHMLRMQSIGGTGSPVYSVYYNFLWLLAPLAIIGLIWLWRQDRNRALLVAVMLLVPLALMLFVLPPPLTELSRRAQYFLYIPGCLLAGVILSRLWLWQKFHLLGLPHQLPKVAAIALIAVLLPSGIISAEWLLYRGLDYNAYLDDTRWQAVHWIGQNTAPGAIIVAYPHPFAWWIEGEAMRDAFDLGDRNMMPYAFEKEQSLVADLILSRNQGLENGNLRLAMTYPYGNASGNPVLAVYVGGIYQDVLMFDDRQNCFAVEGGNDTCLADAQNKEMNVTGDGESMQAVTLYQMNGFEVTQTVILNRGEQAATIRCHINCGSVNLTKFDAPVFFNQQPTSVSIEADKHSFEVTQELKTTFEGIVPVTTIVTVAADGASIEMEAQEQRVVSSFALENDEATITFHFSVATPQLKDDAPVNHYQVPTLIQDYGVDYVAIDLAPPCPCLNEVPKGTEEWFDNCPYYELVYSQGDIRIYQVHTSALTF